MLFYTVDWLFYSIDHKQMIYIKFQVHKPYWCMNVQWEFKEIVTWNFLKITFTMYHNCCTYKIHSSACFWLKVVSQVEHTQEDCWCKFDWNSWEISDFEIHEEISDLWDKQTYVQIEYLSRGFTQAHKGLK